VEILVCKETKNTILNRGDRKRVRAPYTPTIFLWKAGGSCKDSFFEATKKCSSFPPPDNRPCGAHPRQTTAGHAGFALQNQLTEKLEKLPAARHFLTNPSFCLEVPLLSRAETPIFGLF